MLTSPGRSRVLVYLRHVGKCGRAAGTATNGRILGRLTTVRRPLPQLLWVTGYQWAPPSFQLTNSLKPPHHTVFACPPPPPYSFLLFLSCYSTDPPLRMDPNVPNRLPQDSDDEDSISVSTPTLRDLTSLRISDDTLTYRVDLHKITAGIHGGCMGLSQETMSIISWRFCEPMRRLSKPAR